MTGPRLHFLCKFRKKTDATGRIYYTATLGNSRLLLYTTVEGELSFYLGGQLEAENISLKDQLRHTFSKPVDLEAVAK
jgi:hypothetical protein